MGNKVRVAIIGHGHLGRWHTQKANQLEQSELVAIVEPYNQDEIRKTYPGVKVVQDISEVIDEIDAAVIVTPTSTHFELTKYCLEHKKHVFCEKPLCSSIEEAEALAPLTEGLKLQVGHSERCHQIWESIIPKVDEIQGKKTLKISRYAPFKGRATDVDVVQDLMIHDIDLMLYLFKAKPVKITSTGYKIRTDKWDHVTSHFFFENGDEAIVTSGRNHVKEVREFEVMSSSGCLYVDLFKNEFSEGTSTEFSEGEYVRTTSYEKRDHLLIEQEAFYKSILEDQPEFVNYNEGKAAVYFVSKVLESLEKPGILDV